MQDKTKNGIKRTFSIVTAVWSVFVGLLFVIQVWRIFALGAQPYTPENIGAKFAEIAIPTYIWLLLVAVSLVLSLTLPDAPQKAKPFGLSLATTLRRLQSRMPVPSEHTQQQRQKIYTWKVYDVISFCVCGALGLLCTCVAIAYVVGGFEPVSQKGFFAQHQTAEFILRALPWVFGALGTGIFAVYFHAFAQNKQTAIIKELIAEELKRGNKPVIAQKEKKDGGVFVFTQSVWFLPVVRGVVGALAITLIIVGICNGGMTDVFNKAVRICTQCIGLG